MLEELSKHIFAGKIMMIIALAAILFAFTGCEPKSQNNGAQSPTVNSAPSVQPNINIPAVQRVQNQNDQHNQDIENALNGWD